MSGEGAHGQTRLAKVTAVALPSAGTAIAFVIMSRLHVIGDKPVWLVLALLFVAAVIGESSGRMLEVNQSTQAIHVAIGLQCMSVAAIIYTIGWGPTLAIGFLFVAARALDLVGSRAWFVVAIWAAVGTAAGQMAIAFGLVSSYVSVPAVHGLAALEVLGVGVVVWVLGSKTEQSERALGRARSRRQRRPVHSVPAHGDVRFHGRRDSGCRHGGQDHPIQFALPRNVAHPGKRDRGRGR